MRHTAQALDLELPSPGCQPTGTSEGVTSAPDRPGRCRRRCRARPRGTRLGRRGETGSATISSGMVSRVERFSTLPIISVRRTSCSRRRDGSILSSGRREDSALASATSTMRAARIAGSTTSGVTLRRGVAGTSVRAERAARRRIPPERGAVEGALLGAVSVNSATTRWLCAVGRAGTQRRARRRSRTGRPRRGAVHADGEIGPSGRRAGVTTRARTASFAGTLEGRLRFWIRRPSSVRSAAVRPGAPLALVASDRRGDASAASISAMRRRSAIRVVERARFGVIGLSEGFGVAGAVLLRQLREPVREPHALGLEQGERDHLARGRRLVLAIDRRRSDQELGVTSDERRELFGGARSRLGGDLRRASRAAARARGATVDRPGAARGRGSSRAYEITKLRPPRLSTSSA